VIEVVVNGENRSVAPDLTIAALLAELGIRGDAVAVELNLQVLPRDRHGDVRVRDGDRIEVVTFVGGG